MVQEKPGLFFPDFLGFRREESGMSREFCRDVPNPWGCSKSLCKRTSCAFFAPQKSKTTQSTNLFGFPPFSIKHPQDKFSLRNVNWHPPKCKSAPSNKGLATSNLQLLYRTTQKSLLSNLHFWRVSTCILEAKIVLGGALFSTSGRATTTTQNAI